MIIEAQASASAREGRASPFRPFPIHRGPTQGLFDINPTPPLGGRLPPQRLQRSSDVMSQGGDSLGDRPDPIEPQGMDRQAAEGGQDLGDAVLPVAVGVVPSGTSGTQRQLFSINQQSRTCLSTADQPANACPRNGSRLSGCSHRDLGCGQR
jgi:hypothetical protein